MNAKFIIEQIVMSMSFLKADMFREHKFIKQEDEHGMYKCLKAVINHPETGYLQNKVGVATTLETIKEKLGSVLFNWSYLLDVLSEINKLENLEEYKEVLECFYHHLLEKTSVRKVELFLPTNKHHFGLNFGSKLDQSFKLGTLNKELFDKWIDNVLDTNTDLQLGILLEVFNIPSEMVEAILEKEDSYDRRAFTISSLRSFLFDKEPPHPEPKGDSVSDDTQAIQEILNKPVKDKDMKQEQFYTKLYFYTDAKRIVFSDGKVQDIAECFSKLSPVDQASVCHEFGILASHVQHVPGIATVLGTMLMNMDMQILKRKLSDLVSHGFINEFNLRLAECKTWEDANKLHKYAMVTFNGMKIPDLKDIIVKYMSLENHDQFDHDGSQLGGFFAGVIYADAMTMVKRHEEQLQFTVGNSECGEGCQSFGQRVLGSVELSDEDLLRARAYQEELGKLFGLHSNSANKDNPKTKVEDIAYTQPPRIFIVRM